MKTATIPNVPFDKVARRIARYWNPDEYNPHKGILAPTGGGKSYLIRYGLLPIVPRARVVLIDVKPGGEKTWRGWGNDVTEIHPKFGLGPDGTANYRIMLQPGSEGKAQVKRVLNIVATEGNTVLIMDDSRKITAHAPALGYANDVDALITDGRSIGITVILGAGTTTWSVGGLREQCGSYFLGMTNSARQRKEFADISGLPSEARSALDTLKPRQFLYCDRFGDDVCLAITSLTTGQQ